MDTDKRKPVFIRVNPCPSVVKKIFEAYRFAPKEEIKWFYKGRPLKKRYVPDLYVFGCLVVELKAVTELAPEHEAQLFNYMRIAKQPVGYLINFGHKGTLEWKRLILSELIAPPAQDTRSDGCP